MTTTNELDEIKAQYFKSGWDAGRADALAAVPAPTEADREVLHERIVEAILMDSNSVERVEWMLEHPRNPQTHKASRLADAILPLLRTVPAPKTQDGEAREAALEAWASWSEQSEPGTDWESFWAGWRARSKRIPQPRTVSTVEGLEALPVGSIVRNWQDERTDYEDGTWSQGAVAEKRPDLAGQPAWFLVGSALGYRSHQADILPATVLYVPVSPEGGETK